MRNIKYRRILGFLLIIALAFSVWLFSSLYDTLNQTLIFSKASIEIYPILSIFVFLALAAISAILIFFSSVVIVPVAVFAWGEVITFFLLLLGWFIGAMIAYFIGKNFGRKATKYFISEGKINSYGDLFSKEMGIFEVVLLKLALPSEVPSFFLGIIRYPFLKYILVIIISELPFAIWVVYMSVAFVEDRKFLFLAVLISGFAILSVVARIYNKKPK